MNSELIAIDENHTDGTTVYWFRVDGFDHGTGFAFDADVYGIAESVARSEAVDHDGAPVDYNDALQRTILRSCNVTDDMRTYGV